MTFGVLFRPELNFPIARRLQIVEFRYPVSRLTEGRTIHGNHTLVLTRTVKICIGYSVITMDVS
jgi:hypothetical protein